jgi:hypothetical protein
MFHELGGDAAEDRGERTAVAPRAVDQQVEVAAGAPPGACDDRGASAQKRRGRRDRCASAPLAPERALVLRRSLVCTGDDDAGLGIRGCVARDLAQIAAGVVERVHDGVESAHRRRRCHVVRTTTAARRRAAARPCRRGRRQRQARSQRRAGPGRAAVLGWRSSVMASTGRRAERRWSSTWCVRTRRGWHGGATWSIRCRERTPSRTRDGSPSRGGGGRRARLGLTASAPPRAAPDRAVSAARAGTARREPSRAPSSCRSARARVTGSAQRSRRPLLGSAAIAPPAAPGAVPALACARTLGCAACRAR